MRPRSPRVPSAACTTSACAGAEGRTRRARSPVRARLRRDPGADRAEEIAFDMRRGTWKSKCEEKGRAVRSAPRADGAATARRTAGSRPSTRGPASEYEWVGARRSRKTAATTSAGARCRRYPGRDYPFERTPREIMRAMPRPPQYRRPLLPRRDQRKENKNRCVRPRRPRGPAARRRGLEDEARRPSASKTICRTAISRPSSRHHARATG